MHVYMYMYFINQQALHHYRMKCRLCKCRLAIDLRDPIPSEQLLLPLLRHVVAAYIVPVHVVVSDDVTV